MGVSKIPSLLEAFSQFINKKMIVIFDNCDYIDKYFRSEFGHIIKLINNTFNAGLELVAISENQLSI